MKQVSEESNKFASQYRFGGLIAILALLNADLLLDDPILNFDWTIENWPQAVVLALILVVVYFLSRFYFSAINQRIERFNDAYRRTKHKYEILLYGLMLEVEMKELISFLEQEAKPAEIELAFPTEPEFASVASYLHDHHGRKKPGAGAAILESKTATLIVNFAIILKLLSYLLIILK